MGPEIASLIVFFLVGCASLYAGYNIGKENGKNFWQKFKNYLHLNGNNIK